MSKSCDKSLQQNYLQLKKELQQNLHRTKSEIILLDIANAKLSDALINQEAVQLIIEKSISIYQQIISLITEVYDAYLSLNFNTFYTLLLQINKMQDNQQNMCNSVLKNVSHEKSLIIQNGHIQYILAEIHSNYTIDLLFPDFLIGNPISKVIEVINKKNAITNSYVLLCEQRNQNDYDNELGIIDVSMNEIFICSNIDDSSGSIDNYNNAKYSAEFLGNLICSKMPYMLLTNEEDCNVKTIHFFVNNETKIVLSNSASDIVFNILYFDDISLLLHFSNSVTINKNDLISNNLIITFNMLEINQYNCIDSNSISSIIDGQNAFMFFIDSTHFLDWKMYSNSFFQMQFFTTSFPSIDQHISPESYSLSCDSTILSTSINNKMTMNLTLTNSISKNGQTFDKIVSSNDPLSTLAKITSFDLCISQNWYDVVQQLLISYEILLSKYLEYQIFNTANKNEILFAQQIIEDNKQLHYNKMKLLLR